MIHFYTPRKYENIFHFLMFPGSTEKSTSLERVKFLSEPEYTVFLLKTSKLDWMLAALKIIGILQLKPF